MHYSPKDVDNARNGVTHLETLPFVDPGRIGIFGHSRGAMAALIPTKIRNITARFRPIYHAVQMRDVPNLLIYGASIFSLSSITR